MWGGFSGDALGGNLLRVDGRCAVDGSIFNPPPIGFYSDTSGNQCELLSYLPFYYGFDYSGATIVRTDASPSNGMPDRRPAQIYLRPATSGDRWFLPFGQLPSTMVDKFNFGGNLGGFNPTLLVQSDAIQFISQEFTDIGQRAFADVTRDASLAATKKLGCLYDITKLSITAAVRLPYRLRFCGAVDSIPDITARLSAYPAGKFKDWQAARRKKSIDVPRAHLWLAHSQVIWDLQQATITDDGFLAYRYPMGSTDNKLVIVRDDRDRVQFFFQVAKYWYLNTRRRIRVTQEYCGLLDFQKIDPDHPTGPPLVDYGPSINDHVETAYLNGNADGTPTVISTNVTSVDYDHQNCRTTWGTDYFDLEFNV